MVISLGRDADLHMAQRIPLPLSVASVKSRLVLPFWYRLTRVVLDKGPLNGCVCLLSSHPVPALWIPFVIYSDFLCLRMVLFTDVHRVLRRRCSRQHHAGSGTAAD